MTVRIGSYVIERELGRGGMGVVSLARHVVLETRAVVKQLLPELTTDEGAVRRFITEAQAAAALKHRNIVQVIDCGQAADGQWYIVLEYLDGAPLSTRVTQGPLDMYGALAILAQAGNALHTAHGHGIVHRDVKPDNIFLTATLSHVPHVTLLDFGIAKLHDNRAHLTRTGMGIGTPAYMPPEQLVAAKDVDERADVYALGVVAFEMITGGHLPWQATAPAAIYALQTAQAPPDARESFDRVSPEWALVIQHAMIAQREERLPSVRELILALAEATPADALCPEGGIEIVRRHAPELLATAPSDDTIGSRLAQLEPVAAPIAVPVDLGIGKPTRPLVAHRAAAPSATETMRPVPPAGWTPPASDAPRVTTLGSATGQSSAGVAQGGSAVPRRRRGLAIAGGVVVIAGATAALVAGLGNSGEPTAPSHTGPMDATSDRATTARMSESEPDAAAPPIDAGISVEASPSIDAGRSRVRPHGRKPGVDAGGGAGSGSTFDPDAVGGGH